MLLHPSKNEILSDVKQSRSALSTEMERVPRVQSREHRVRILLVFL